MRTIVDVPDRLETSNPAATLSGHVLGTPAYMAPEQAEGRVELIGPLTDVYGLGAILYEILTGHPPFQGSNTIEILQKVCYSEPLPPSQVTSGVPSDLERICLQGLSKPQAQRQRSAEEVANSIEQWMADLAEQKRVEEERRRAEEQRERFFALSLDLLAILDEELRATQLSPAWQRLLGISVDELRYRPFTELIDSEDRELIIAKLKDVVRTKQSSNFEGRCIAIDGSRRFVLWNVTWIQDERSAYVVGRDVTDLKRSEQHFLSLLESAPDAYVVADAGGRIVRINAQTERLFGYTRDELQGQPVEVLMAERIRVEHVALREGYCKAPTPRPMNCGRYLLARRKDGREVRVEIALSPVHAVDGLLIIAAVRERRRPTDSVASS